MPLDQAAGTVCGCHWIKAIFRSAGASAANALLAPSEEERGSSSTTHAEAAAPRVADMAAAFFMNPRRGVGSGKLRLSTAIFVSFG
jgi:hypothetical protein